MNHKERQLINRAIKRHTAFKSFADLLGSSLLHKYTPSIYPWRGAKVGTVNRLRALAQQYDDAMEAIGQPYRAYRGSGY